MNAQEQIKFIVENTDGECWHRIRYGVPSMHFKGEHDCVCGRLFSTCTHPSPHSLDDLFRLARKATDLGCISFTYEGDLRELQGLDYTPVICWLGCNGKEYETAGKTEADALRSALITAIEARK